MPRDVVAITLVKDEADIIERTITWMAGQVDCVIAIDNGSTDGTRELLEDLPCWVGDDPDPAHWQARKITALAREVGGGFIVPFDADEIWYATDRDLTVADAIRANPRGWIWTAELITHVPTDHPGDHPFDRLAYRQRTASPLSKVAARWAENMTFTEGAHSVHYDGEYPSTLNYKLEIRHFPYRSPSQFISKALNGYRGRMLTTLPDDISPHLRQFGAIHAEGGDEALQDFYWTNLYKETSDPELIKDPCPA
jgi:hypothetical protein